MCWSMRHPSASISIRPKHPGLSRSASGLKAAAEQLPAIHPENPEIHTINQTLFAGPLEEHDGVKRSRNAVIVSPGRIDRSPCGTGTSARLAVMHARGQVAIGETFIHESIIGTEFIGRVLGETTCGEGAICPAITGQAWITAFHNYVLDPTDPFPTGFRLGDTGRATDRERTPNVDRSGR